MKIFQWFLNDTFYYLIHLDSCYFVFVRKFDNLQGKTFDGYSFVANSVSMNLDTSFIFIDGPVIGGKDNINFDAGKIEIHEKGSKIFFSSGIRLKISKPISELKND